jgi:phage gpG-like protein
VIINNLPKAAKELDEFKEYLLTEAGLLVQGDAKDELSKPKPHRGGGSFPAYDTGNLANSITYVVDKDSVRIGTPLEYAIYIEKGAKAHWTSVKNLTEWVSRKFKGMTEKEQTSISYAIQHNIAKEDMPAMPFLETAFMNNMFKLIELLGVFKWKWFDAGRTKSNYHAEDWKEPMENSE